MFKGVQTQVEKTKGLDIERKLDVLGCKEEIQISLEGPNMKDQSSVNDDQTLAKTKEISIESNSDVLKGKEEIETSLEKLSMKDQSSGNVSFIDSDNFKFNHTTIQAHKIRRRLFTQMYIVN
ncbi:uncharacterized protein LOC130629956 [Hydractinia symbiolongicarpus]|uniref:uncharacterized protein LOC130629956 n=1 Tax=Hydractinia symbiolongicarpus TaxID=13093 RepID=UPI00254E9D5D|nr:uncharacterized protein LOC130629956 [Hydractinia symbiolongicarpus]